MANAVKEKPVVQQVAAALKEAKGQPFDFGAARIHQRGNMVIIGAAGATETTEEEEAATDGDAHS